MLEEPDELVQEVAVYQALPLEEVAEQLRLLLASPANYARLRRMASARCAGVAGMTGDDLLHETLTRFYEGRRKWPRNVHPLVILNSAMHSIASDERQSAARSPVDENVALASGSAEEGSTDVRPQVHGVSRLTPEDDLSGRQQVAALYAVVAGDEDLELLVMVWADGQRGEDAANELGWDMKKYEAARKRLTRRLDALDPDRRHK